MAIELKQSLKLTQQLLITPQLQQAIKLLQLSRHELIETVQQELLENPVLEESQEANNTNTDADTARISDLNTSPEANNAETAPQDASEKLGSDVQDFDWANYVETYSAPTHERKAPVSKEDLPNYENMVSNSTSLHDHLEWQVHLGDFTEKEKQACFELIGHINENGYLPLSLEEIAEKTDFTFDDLDDSLCIIHELDPLGVGARNLKECLKLQIKDHPERKLIQTVIEEHLDLVEKRNHPAIAKKMKVSPAKAKDLIFLISRLEPKPGRSFAATDTQYITPDIYIKEVGDEFVVVLNEDGMPKLQISHFYKSAIKKEIANRGDEAEANKMSSKEEEAQNYIQDKLKNALWLIKSIHQRQKTLYKVTKSISKFQKDFLVDGVHKLKPLVLRDVADDIGVHESTVSRATNGKYVHTPQGIFELKYFFNTGLSNSAGGKDFANEAVKQMVKELIGTENPKSPLSDQAIADYLKSKSVNIARRTVAKYREMLGILPSSKRKRLY